MLQTEEKDKHLKEETEWKHKTLERLIKTSLRKHRKMNKIMEISTHIFNDSEYEEFWFTNKKT